MALPHPATSSRGSPCHLDARAPFSPRRAFVGGWPRRTILLPSQMVPFVLRCPFQSQHASRRMAPLRPCSSHLLGTEGDQTLKESGAPMCWPVCVHLCAPVAHPVAQSFWSLCTLGVQSEMRSWPSRSLQSSRSLRCQVKSDSLLPVVEQGWKA